MAREDKRFLESVELAQITGNMQVVANRPQTINARNYNIAINATGLNEQIRGIVGSGRALDFFDVYLQYGINIDTNNINDNKFIVRFKLGDYYLGLLANTTFNTLAIILTTENVDNINYSINTNYTMTLDDLGISQLYDYKVKLLMCLVMYEQHTYLCFSTINNYDRGESNAYTNFRGFDVSDLNSKIGKIEWEIQSGRFGNYSKEGGYSSGSFDTSSDAIGVPELPTLGVSTTGFINIYSPSINELVNFGDDLFPDFQNANFPDLSGEVGLREIGQAIGALVDNVYNIGQSFINSKLIDYVIDCHIIPCYPSVGTKEKIKVGFKTFNQESLKVTSDYVSVDCGSLNIAEYYNNFIDYVGTDAKLYLPFVGFVGLEPEFFQNGTIKVVYSFNIVDGSFMVHVLSTSSKSKLKDTVIGSYSGNCCVHIPITGLNYSTLVTSVLNGTGATISNLTSGNVMGAVDNALNTLSSKPSMQNSNGYSSSSAFLGIRKPYLLISRVVSSFSANYTQENGLPLNVSKTLSEMSGLTVVKNAILDGLSCTTGEKEMIKNMLEKGVIL